jgi:hypothetical protein
LAEAADRDQTFNRDDYTRESMLSVKKSSFIFHAPIIKKEIQEDIPAPVQVEIVPQTPSGQQNKEPE